jgi:hypothetical protein
LATVNRRRISLHLVMLSALVALSINGFADTARSALSISVPSSKNVGSTQVGNGQTLSAQLGTVTVNASGIVAPSFVVTVTSTVFTTGSGSANETIAKSRISYWSGTATSTTGTFLTLTPGQANAAAAQDLSLPRTAFTAVGLVLTIAVSWNPTLVVNPPSGAVAGTYSGTITHSVA